METTTTQVLFFQHIKALLPPHISMVDELAGLLNISNDSAYRRIRGDKPITLDEMQKLATHFKLSLDQFLHLQSDTFIFNGKLANAGDHTFEKWLADTLAQLRYINQFQHKHMYYLAKDIPLMQQFLVPELIIFKSFLWRRSILHYDSLKNLKFSLSHFEAPHVELATKIVNEYNQLPSTEIWNIESINSTIRQIEFYRESDMFQSEDDISKLYAAVLKLIDHLEKQAETGLKFCIDEKPSTMNGSYHLFVNELILGDNTVMAELDNMKVTFLNHSVINYLITYDERFNNHMFDAMQNIIRKSTHLSQIGEKERMRFFNRIRDKMKLAARL